MIHRQLPPKPLHGFAGSIGSPHRTRKSSCPESEFSLASSGSRQLQSRAHAGYDKPDAASGSFAQEPRPGGDLTEREEWADVIFVIFASFVSCHPHGGGERDTARRRRRRSKKAWKRQSTCRAGLGANYLQAVLSQAWQMARGQLLKSLVLDGLKSSLGGVN